MSSEAVADFPSPTSPTPPTTPIKQHCVEEVLEQWRVDDEWWRDPICRRYVDVVLEGGGHVVLFEDLMTGNWFVQKP